MESLWIENRRNAIGIETDPTFFNNTVVLDRFSACEGERIQVRVRIVAQQSIKESSPPLLRVSRSVDRRTDN